MYLQVYSNNCLILKKRFMQIKLIIYSRFSILSRDARFRYKKGVSVDLIETFVILDRLSVKYRAPLPNSNTNPTVSTRKKIVKIQNP